MEGCHHIEGIRPGPVQELRVGDQHGGARHNEKKIGCFEGFRTVQANPAATEHGRVKCHIVIKTAQKHAFRRHKHNQLPWQSLPAGQLSGATNLCFETTSAGPIGPYDQKRIRAAERQYADGSRRSGSGYRYPAFGRFTA